MQPHNRRILIVLLALVLPSFVTLVLHAGEITSITVFGCDAAGNQDAACRWNSGPVDAAWDLFLYEGSQIAKDGAGVKWLNDPATRTIRLSPKGGRTTWTVHFDGNRGSEYFGLNIQTDGETTMSVMAKVSGDPKNPEPFTVNRALHTMGFPVTEVPASGTLRCETVSKSLWIWSGDVTARRLEVVDFKVFSPEAAGNVDLVGPGATEPSGRADWVIQFTVQSEEVGVQPPDWLLWLSVAAEMRIGENDAVGDWKKRFDMKEIPAVFSFLYGGVPSKDFLKTWEFAAEHKRLDENRIAHVLTWTDPKTGLEVRFDGLEFTDFESVEWTVYLTNKGKENTPIIERLQAIDAGFTRANESEYLLRHWKGTMVTADDFEPLQTTLEPGKTAEFRPSGGRCTGGNWPYYNLHTGDEGILLAIGWPGRWLTRFRRDARNGLRITSGQEACRFTLYPGETVRSPLVVMQFWKGGDWIDAQNTWRRWMVKHNIPRSNGKLPPLPMLNACSSHQFAEMTQADEQSQKDFIDMYLDKGLKLDYWWMDAGWYVGAAENGWPWTGTWEVDRRPHRFPNGLRAISDYGRSKGVKTIVWFEPERVAGGTWLATEHPDWILGGSLLNLGNPEAFEWLVNHVSKIITDEGIDLYRQDYNIDPISMWRSGDTKDREGITENKYVMGYLAYWDALLERHPGMLIDSCASGGHRNDLETMRRALPLLRSDYLFEPVGQQAQTYGLSFWIPFHGTAYCPSNSSVGWGYGTGSKEAYGPYIRRSNMCPSGTGCFDFREPVDDALILRLYKEWKDVGRYYFGDFYPLTDYNRAADAWIGWQFHSPEDDAGFIQAFRREACVYKAADMLLRGLNPDTVYTVTDFDAVGRTVKKTGRELMEGGVEIVIPDRPGAALLKYEARR